MSARTTKAAGTSTVSSRKAADHAKLAQQAEAGATKETSTVQTPVVTAQVTVSAPTPAPVAAQTPVAAATQSSAPQAADAAGESSPQPEAETGATESAAKSKSKRALNSEEVLGLLESLVAQNESEQSALRTRATRLKEQSRVLKDLRKYLSKPSAEHGKRSAANKSTVPRNPTGFAKPRGISDEMFKYLTQVAGVSKINVSRANEEPTELQLTPDCKLARNELTKVLCAHFKDRNMRKNPDDQRKIYLDKETCELFRINPSTFTGTYSEAGEPIISYFDLQKYLPVHCLKAE